MAVQKLYLLDKIREHKSADILMLFDQELLDFEICLAAVRANGLAIKDVPPAFRSNFVVLESLRNDRRAYYALDWFTDDPIFDITCFNEFVKHYKRDDFLDLIRRE